MLDSNLLMRRAVRYVCDEHNLVPESVKLFDHKTKNRFRDLTVAIGDDMRYNQLKYFRPFEHQK